MIEERTEALEKTYSVSVEVYSIDGALIRAVFWNKGMIAQRRARPKCHQ